MFTSRIPYEQALREPVTWNQRSIRLSLLLPYTHYKKSTLSKGTLAYIGHIPRTSRRCANQRLRPAINPSLSLTTIYSLQKSTLSKGTLAYLRHVSRTSRRCANQRHATSPIDSSLSLSLPLRDKQNTANRMPRVLQEAEKFYMCSCDE